MRHRPSSSVGSPKVELCTLSHGHMPALCYVLYLLRWQQWLMLDTHEPSPFPYRFDRRMIVAAVS